MMMMMMMMMMIIITAAAVVMAAVVVAISTSIRISRNSKLHTTVIFSSTLIHLNITMALQDARHFHTDSKAQKHASNTVKPC
jgi:hypothetical protein